MTSSPASCSHWHTARRSQAPRDASFARIAAPSVCTVVEHDSTSPRSRSSMHRMCTACASHVHRTSAPRTRLQRQPAHVSRHTLGTQILKTMPRRSFRWSLPPTRILRASRVAGICLLSRRNHTGGGLLPPHHLKSLAKPLSTRKPDPAVQRARLLSACHLAVSYRSSVSTGFHSLNQPTKPHPWWIRSALYSTLNV